MATKQKFYWFESVKDAQAYAKGLLKAYDEEPAKACDMLNHADLLHLCSIINVYVRKLEEEYGLGF